jgi:Tfp pilus assembly protein PilF
MPSPSISTAASADAEKPAIGRISGYAGTMSNALIEAARAAMNAGKDQDARDLAQAVLASDPRSVDALEILFLAASRRGDRVDAEQALRHILSIAPDATWARDDLARLLIEDEREAEAEAEVRTALAADADHADAHAMLGTMLSQREMLVEGAIHFRRAIALAGPHPELLLHLGRNLMRQGSLDEAARLAAAAERAAPDRLATAVLVAEIAEQRGDLGEAHRALARAEPLAAREGRDALMLRATLLSRDARWAEGLALLDGLPALSGAARLLRGRLRERAGRHDDAWSDFVAGKAALARAAGRRYDPQAVDAHFARLAALSPAGLPRPARREGPQPLFILGLPRSGTTMAEQLLTSHPAIRAGGELPFTAQLRDFAARMLGAGQSLDFGRMVAADHHHVPALFRDFYLARADLYGLRAPEAALFTDKMPLNEIYLPLLRLAFPDTPMVMVRRHPLDVLVSIMAHDMTHGFDCGYRLEDAAHQIAAVSALTDRYRTTIAPAPHLFGYERFVADQAGETARLMAHVGLPVDPAQARFHDNRRHAPTPSYAQVREPLHDRSIGRWRHYRAQLEPVIPIVAAAMERGGYSL